MLGLSPTSPLCFDIEELESIANNYKESYINNTPYPHIVIDNFLSGKDARNILSHFPPPDSPAWIDWKKRNTKRQPKKLGIGHASRLAHVSPYLQTVLSAFNSYPFLNFLSILTGKEKLLPDPYFHGGGLHQTLSGGKLSVHTDFNNLDSLDLFRQINVILFLNKNWKPEYNGNLELWDAERRECRKSISPIFNRLVIFNTNKNTFHGHPIPLNTPESITRKSLAFYYYTSRPTPNEKYDKKTDWIDTNNQ